MMIDEPMGSVRRKIMKKSEKSKMKKKRILQKAQKCLRRGLGLSWSEETVVK